jgi:hypothetical protein
MNVIFEHPWWVTFWLIIIFDGVGRIGNAIKKED